MTARGWFVTGTDTGVGKTWVSQALLRALAETGKRVAGMKPIASGCSITPAGLRSTDAEDLMAAANVAAEYSDVNPYAFEPATAPSLAARAVGAEIRLDVIRDHYNRLAARAELVVVEGVGGWLAPLDATKTVADLAAFLELPVILVVGLRLGAVNHALLTEMAIQARGCRLSGWIANAVDADVPAGYTEMLQSRLRAPMLGAISHGMNPLQSTRQLDANALLRAAL